MYFLYRLLLVVKLFVVDVSDYTDEEKDRMGTKDGTLSLYIQFK